MVQIVALILSIIIVSAARADERFITLGSTTSAQDSGLFGYILPIFKAVMGLGVHVVAVGTGQALARGERGDVDALLVHDRVGEDKFVAQGFGIDRRDVMFNDFLIVGPKSDLAHIRGLKGNPPTSSRTRTMAGIALSGKAWAQLSTLLQRWTPTR